MSHWLKTKIKKWLKTKIKKWSMTIAMIFRTLSPEQNPKECGKKTHGREDTCPRNLTLWAQPVLSDVLTCRTWEGSSQAIASPS